MPDFSFLGGMSPHEFLSEAQAAAVKGKREAAERQRSETQHICSKIKGKITQLSSLGEIRFNGRINQSRGRREEQQWAALSKCNCEIDSIYAKGRYHANKITGPDCPNCNLAVAVAQAVSETFEELGCVNVALHPCREKFERHQYYYDVVVEWGAPVAAPEKTRSSNYCF